MRGKYHDHWLRKQAAIDSGCGGKQELGQHLMYGFQAQGVSE